MNALPIKNFIVSTLHSFLNSHHLNGTLRHAHCVGNRGYHIVSLCLGVGCLTLVPLNLGTKAAVAQLAVTQESSRSDPNSALNILFVNPKTGDDTQGQGSERSPWKTITQALKVAQPNTVILLAPGIYSTDTGEIFPVVLKSGVTLQGNPRTRGENIVIRGGGSYLSSTANSQNVTIVGANQAGLMGVTITNPNPQGYGLWIEASSPLVVDNTFTGNTQGGISVNGNSAPTIRSNYFYKNGGDGITVAGTLQPEVRENVFENNSFGVPVAETTVPSVINWPSPPASTISATPEGNPLRDDTQVDRNNQAFKPRLINFGSQLRQSINSTPAERAASLEPSTPASSPSLSPSAEIEQPSAFLQSNSVRVTENQSSTSVEEPTTPTTPNVPSESGSTAQEAITNSQSTSQSATTSTVQTLKPPAPVEAASPQPTPETTASSTRISAASFPFPALLRSQLSTSPSEGSSTPDSSSLSTPLISPSVASVSNNRLISASLQETSQLQQVPQTQGVEIPVPPLDASIEPLGTVSPTSTQISTPENQNTVAPVDLVLMNATTASAGQNVRYRVLVEAQGNTQQDLVRSLVPGAFRTSFNGQAMMQAGVFTTVEKANAMQQFLNSKGLVATVEPAN